MDADTTHRRPDFPLMTAPSFAAAPVVLPLWAGRPLNRCNLPVSILGGEDFQRRPEPLMLDGVEGFHEDLFAILDAEPERRHRAEHFQRYMNVKFRLEYPEDAGYQGGRKGRVKADYLRTLRGWSFDSDGREAAVLKGWVESRFGLVARFHKVPLRRYEDEAFMAYQRAWAEGLFGTNALEAQLDLVYTYCQYELSRPRAPETRITLYRGINRLEDFEILVRPGKWRAVVLLNNLNSFTSNRDLAGQFGDYILSAEVPLQKVFCYSDLLPGRLRGEEEMMVVGGVYAVEVAVL